MKEIYLIWPQDGGAPVLWVDPIPFPVDDGTVETYILKDDVDQSLRDQYSQAFNDAEQEISETALYQDCVHLRERLAQLTARLNSSADNGDPMTPPIENPALYDRLDAMSEEERCEILDPIATALKGKVKINGGGIEVLANRILALAVLDLYKDWQLEIFNRD